MHAERKDQIIPMYEDMARLANAAAAMTDATVKIRHTKIYAERHSNRVLDEAFKANKEVLGEEFIWLDPNGMFGSSDIGNISLVGPAIHEYLSLECGMIGGHTPEFSDTAVSARADNLVPLAAKGLAMTGADSFPEIREAMRKNTTKRQSPVGAEIVLTQEKIAEKGILSHFWEFRRYNVSTLKRISVMRSKC